jgi:6-phosphogluconolactonase
MLWQVSLLLILLGCYVHEVTAGIVFVGTEANSIYSCYFDDFTGAISLLNSTAAEFPSFLALHPSREFMFTVNEVQVFQNQNNSGGISAYKIDRLTGNITLINSVPSFGGDPAYIGLDATARWVGVANYEAGNYGVWMINNDFSIAPKATSFFQDIGKGPMPQQDGPHAHEFVFDRTNTFVVVPDLGNDSWDQYFFDERSGILTPASPPAIKAPAGSGPRHIAFHPTLPYAYGVSEIASTITVFSVPKPLTSLSVIQIINTLPVVQPSAAAEVQLSPDGKVLYMTNRLTGVNGTFTIFSIDQSTGKLTTIGYASTLGIEPRFFTLSRDGRFVLVANQLSNNIRVFARDERTGLIGALVSSLYNLNSVSHILQV